MSAAERCCYIAQAVFILASRHCTYNYAGHDTGEEEGDEMDEWNKGGGNYEEGRLNDSENKKERRKRSTMERSKKEEGAEEDEQKTREEKKEEEF